MIDRPLSSPILFPSSPPHACPLEHSPCELEDYTCLIGESFRMRSLRAQLRRISPHLRIALISGEPGTCKETAALALHRLSGESDSVFLSHTASSLIDYLASLLAISSVGTARETLFITGIATLSRPLQLELLSLLQLIASWRTAPDRPRLIFATASDLRSLAAAGQIDRALYRKISAVDILLPTLRSRPEDIPLITSSLLARSSTTCVFDGLALSRLQSHDWPGNIRELERAVELARENATYSPGDIIEAEHLPSFPDRTRNCVQSGLRPGQPGQSDQSGHVDRLDSVIQNHVLDVLLRCSGNKLRAAERLGISRSTLYRMLEAGASSTPLVLNRTA